MTASMIDPTQLEQAFDSACRTIAPAWPLDQSVAINPHWQRIGRPLRDIAARLALLGGFQVFPARTYVQRCWQDGRIQAADLEAALLQYPQARLSRHDCLAMLIQDPGINVLPLLIDLLDDAAEHHRRLSWRQAIMHQTSQTAAAYFDSHQAHWQPISEQGFYAFWHDTVINDHGVGTLMGLKRLRTSLEALPAERHAAETWALERLGLDNNLWADYLEALLLSVNGWASWCAWLDREATAQQQAATNLRELLAVRLAWEALLVDCVDRDPTRGNVPQAQYWLGCCWKDFAERERQAAHKMLVDEIWQVALETGYQRQLAAKLTQPTAATTQRRPETQAFFCIDCRSEPMRRALEATGMDIETRGFAGFFGVPLAYRPFASAVSRPQMPGLGFPSVEVTEIITQPRHPQPVTANIRAQAVNARQQRLAARQQSWAAIHWPNTTFSFVEAAGIGYLGRIWRWLLPSRGSRPADDLSGLPEHYRPLARPVIQGLDDAAKVSLAAGVLRTMGIDQQQAPLVLLIGHGSQSCNNAHASTLDCGACGGQAGEANARALAQLLNEPRVRAGLKQHEQIVINDDCVFVAGLHNTATDEIEGFDLDLLPIPARRQWQQFSARAAKAGAVVRRGRAAALWMCPDSGDQTLLDSFRRRANDGSETRPEWGLTGNAALVIGPREITRGKHLERSYLHTYHADRDSDGSLLEQLMLGPMLVTHWISWQYHASTCDPLHYGSGNKVLHNVVGGHIGVFEGNGGDLRIGMPKQSLHDGNNWRHEPIRLTVIIAAPSERISAIIERQPSLKQVFDNDWMLLWARDENGGLQRYRQGRWEDLTLSPRPSPAADKRPPQPDSYSRA